MTGRVPGCVRVVQGRHLLVPIVVPGRTQIGAAQEGAVALHFDLGLEGVGRFLFVEWFGRLPVVDQEHGGRQSAGGNRLELWKEPPFDMELQAARGGNVVYGGAFSGPETDRDDLLARRPLPEAAAAACVVLLCRALVVPPADRDAEPRAFAGQEAQTHRRREERPLRRLSILVRFLGEARPIGNLVEVVVVLIVPAHAEFRRRAGRDQEAGEVPVRGRLARGQPFAGEFVARAGADQVELEGVDEVLADFFGGLRGRVWFAGFTHAANTLKPVPSWVADRAASCQMAALSLRVITP